MDGNALARFWAKIECDESGCWLWTGALAGKTASYGDLRIGKTNKRAHRLAFVHYIGPIPHGHELHHTCGVKRCVNPWHLQPMTRGDHARHHVTNTHCPRGHELTGANLYLYLGKYRKCRECGRASWRAWNSRRVTA